MATLSAESKKQTHHNNKNRQQTHLIFLLYTISSLCESKYARGDRCHEHGHMHPSEKCTFIGKEKLWFHLREVQINNRHYPGTDKVLTF
jgi:hypothetical protein